MQNTIYNECVCSRKYENYKSTTLFCKQMLFCSGLFHSISQNIHICKVNCDEQNASNQKPHMHLKAFRADNYIHWKKKADSFIPGWLGAPLLNSSNQQPLFLLCQNKQVFLFCFCDLASVDVAIAVVQIILKNREEWMTTFQSSRS